MTSSHTAQLPALYRPLRRLFIAAISLAIVVTMAVVVAATDFGILALNATARGVARAGFDINEVKVSGNVNASRLDIVSAVLNGSTNSMLFADIDDMRARIEQNSWVETATVTRKLPSRIEIQIVERRPAALWQSGGQFAVIDAQGRVLTTRNIAAFATLPRIVGADAAVHVPALFALLATQPELAAQVDAAVWVSGRRWDLLFKTGERMLLPEGAAASSALARFALLNNQKRLFGLGFVRFDLRVADRLVASLPPEASKHDMGEPSPAPATPSILPNPAVREIRI